MANMNTNVMGVGLTLKGNTYYPVVIQSEDYTTDDKLMKVINIGELCFIISTAIPMKTKNIKKYINDNIEYHFKHLKEYKSIIKKHIKHASNLKMSEMNFDFFIELYRILDTHLETIQEQKLDYSKEELLEMIIKSKRLNKKDAEQLRALSSIFIDDIVATTDNMRKFNISRVFYSIRNNMEMKRLVKMAKECFLDDNRHYKSDIVKLLNGDSEFNQNFLISLMYGQMIKVKDYKFTDIADISDDVIGKFKTREDAIDYIEDYFKDCKYDAIPLDDEYFYNVDDAQKIIVDCMNKIIPMKEFEYGNHTLDIRTLTMAENLLSFYNLSFVDTANDLTVKQKKQALVTLLNIDEITTENIIKYAPPLYVITGLVETFKSNIQNIANDFINNIEYTYKDFTNSLKDEESKQKLESKVFELQKQLNELKSSNKESLRQAKQEGYDKAKKEISDMRKKYEKRIEKLNKSLKSSQIVEEVICDEVEEDNIDLSILSDYSVVIVTNPTFQNKFNGIEDYFKNVRYVDGIDGKKEVMLDKHDILIYDKICINHAGMKYYDKARKLDMPIINTDSTNLVTILNKVATRLK